MKSKNTVKEILRHENTPDSQDLLFENSAQVTYLKQDLMKTMYFLAFSLVVILIIGVLMSDLQMFNSLRDNLNIEKFNF